MASSNKGNIVENEKFIVNEKTKGKKEVIKEKKKD